MANRRGESGIHHSAAATAIALLFVAACGGDSGSSTTSSTTSTSVPGSSTTTGAGPTTQPPTTGGTGTTAETPDTLPPVIAEVAFAFAAGDDPRLRVRVSVAESRDGPWLSAGIFDPSQDDKLTYCFAHRLRIRLWAHHLGMDSPHGYAELADGIASSCHWRTLPASARVAPYDLWRTGSKVLPDFAVDPESVRP